MQLVGCLSMWQVVDSLKRRVVVHQATGEERQSRKRETTRMEGGTDEGGEGGPLDNAVNRESSLSHRARQNTSATTVRSFRNPPTALGVDSPRRRLVGRGLSKFTVGLTLARPTGHDRSRSPISSSATGRSEIAGFRSKE